MFPQKEAYKMNQQQKDAVYELRAKGKSYTNIADLLDISENTIKSYCHRNDLGGIARQALEVNEFLYCRNCGAPLKQVPKKKQKRYCSDKCRLTWWNAHPQDVTHKKIRSFICQTCGIEFESFGKRERKYCSHACYGKSKAVRHE